MCSPSCILFCNCQDGMGKVGIEFLISIYLNVHHDENLDPSPIHEVLSQGHVLAEVRSSVPIGFQVLANER